MYLPLNVLLFQLSVNCTYEASNVDLTRRFEGIKLFNADAIPDEGSNFLYLVSEQMLATHASSLLSQQILSGTTFLCVCQGEDRLDEFRDSLSLVLLYTEEPFVSIFNRILTLFSDIAVWDKEVHMALLEKRPMQDLLDLSRAYLICPTLVLDRSCTVLGQFTPQGQELPLLREVCAGGYVPPRLMNQLRQSSTGMPGWNGPEMRLGWYHREGQERQYVVMYRFQAGGHDAGCVLLFCGSQPLRNDYLHLLSILCGNLSMYFQRERSGTLFSEEDYETLLVDILEHPDHPAKQYEHQLDFVPGLTMEGAFALARLEYDPPAQLPHTVVGWNLRNLIPELRPFVWNGRFYILRAAQDLAGVEQFLTDQERAAFCGSMGRTPFLCAVSQPFISLMGLATAAAQCEAALALCRTPKGQGQSFCTFARYYGPYLLQQAKQSRTLPMLVSPHYEVLRRYDEDHGTELCTLFMHFLENQRSVNQTAAAVYLHRNTVMNRIKKAVSIMGGECSGCGAQTAFFLSYLNDHPAWPDPDSKP